LMPTLDLDMSWLDLPSVDWQSLFDFGFDPF